MNIFYEEYEVIDPQLQKAAGLLRKGESYQARVILATFLKAYPENEQAWHMLRNVLEDQEQTVSAMQKLLQDDPKNTQAISWLAKLSTPMLETNSEQGGHTSPEKADSIVFQGESLQSAKQADLKGISWLSDLSTPMTEQTLRQALVPIEDVGTSSMLSKMIKRRTILITGNLSSLASAIAVEFLTERDKVVLASDDVENLGMGLEKAILHTCNPADSVFRDVLSSNKFDVIIYIATREEQLLNVSNYNTGQALDGLRNALELSKNVERFLYISSTEVYGKDEDTLKYFEPHPVTINRNTLLAGEQYCNFYRQNYGLNTIVVRVPYIYGPGEKGTLLYRIVDACLGRRVIEIPTGEETICNFLHAEDVAEFIKRVLDEAYRSRIPVIDLSSADNLTFGKLIQMLEPDFPALKPKFDETFFIFTQPVEIAAAWSEFDWVARRELRVELPKMIAAILEVAVPRKSIFDKVKTAFAKYQNRSILKWVELILGAVVMQFLVEVTGTLLQFKIVDSPARTAI